MSKVEDLSARSGPIQADYRERMNALATALDEILNGPNWKDRKGDQIGFFLAMYPMGEEGRFNYISNSDKLDVRAMLKEIIARIEGRLSQSGQA